MHSIEAVSLGGPAVGHRDRMAEATPAGDTTAVAAVLAHSLLNSIAVVRGGTELLARHHEALPEDERHEWFRRVDDHADFLALVLERVAQGRLADALALSERGCRPERSPRSVAAGRGRSTIRPV